MAVDLNCPACGGACLHKSGKPTCMARLRLSIAARKVLRYVATVDRPVGSRTLGPFWRAARTELQSLGLVSMKVRHGTQYRDVILTDYGEAVAQGLLKKPPMTSHT